MIKRAFSFLSSLFILPIFPLSTMSASAQSAEGSLPAWKQVTEGTNLVAGKAAWLFPAPNWGGKPPEYYSGLLTDEKLSDTLTYGLYEAGDAVRWAWSHLDCIILFDLESSQPVDRISARFFGGKNADAQGGRMAFPKEFEVFVSDDKVHFHRITNLTKTLPAEQDTADWKRTYYLEEKKQGYTHIFTFPVGVKTRYIGLRVKRDRDKVLLDEVAVMKADSEITATPSDFPKMTMAIDSAIASFRTEKLFITPAFPTPNWIDVQDTREDQKAPLKLTLELPDEVYVSGWLGIPPTEKIQDEASSRTIYVLPFAKLPLRPASVNGPLYIQKHDSASLAEGSYAILKMVYEGFEHEQKIELAELDIPTVPVWTDFEISLGWMWDEWAITWPDFFKAYRALGFNTIPTFPRYHHTNATPYLKSFSKEEKLAFLQKGREDNFRILYNESPFHVLFNKHQKKNPEVLNQLNEGPGKHLSPIYRGEFYTEEINRVADHFLATKANTIFLDIELWHLSLPEARQSQEYQNALKTSGKSEDAFLGDLGYEMIRDIRDAIKKRATENDIPMPLLGLYSFLPDENLRLGVFDWKKLYPEVIDFAMPSLYVGGNVNNIHDIISSNRKKIGANRIIPWLTAGTFGIYAPVRLEYMIYETLLNGANGFTYYWYPDFDPEHFYYQAKALQTLHPFEKLLKSGTPLSLSGSDEALTYSAFGSDSHALLLIGNYDSNQERKTTLTLPNKNITKVQDIRSGQEYFLSEDTQTIEITVEGNNCVLLEVK